jgi:hypothetical protein
VDSAFDSHSGYLVGAIRAACRAVLEFADDNRLLQAVVSASHGNDNELLPLLTTQSHTLIETAKNVVRRRLSAFTLPRSGREVDAATDMLVRTVLSHVMQPSATPEATADGIALVIARLLVP